VHPTPAPLPSGTGALRIEFSTLCGWVAACVVVGMLMVNRSGGTPFDSDDCLYLMQVREARALGEWLDWRFQGALVFQRPPGFLWLLGAAGTLTGSDDLGSARWVSTLGAALLALSTWRFARHLGGGPLASGASVCLALSSTLVVFMSRRVMADILLAALVMSALQNWASIELAPVSRRDEDRGWDWLRLGLWIGAATMLKGFVGALFLLGPVAGALLRARGPEPLPRRLRPLVMLLSGFLVLAAPWHALALLRHGAAFLDEYVLRNLVDRAMRARFAAYDPLYYVSALWDFDGPLVLIALPALLALLPALRHPSSRVRRAHRASTLMLVLSAAPMAARTQLPHYALVFWIVLLALGGAWFARLMAPVETYVTRRLGRIARAGAVTLTGIALTLPVALNIANVGLDHGAAIARTGERIRDSGRSLIALDVYSPALFLAAGAPVQILAHDPVFADVTLQEEILARSGAVRSVTDGHALEDALRLIEAPACLVVRADDLGEYASALADARGHAARVELDGDLALLWVDAR